jgi:hypothetical protein
MRRICVALLALSAVLIAGALAVRAANLAQRIGDNLMDSTVLVRVTTAGVVRTGTGFAIGREDTAVMVLTSPELVGE